LNDSHGQGGHAPRRNIFLCADAAAAGGSVFPVKLPAMAVVLATFEKVAE
jgi:hypothetical protein